MLFSEESLLHYVSVSSQFCLCLYLYHRTQPEVPDSDICVHRTADRTITFGTTHGDINVVWANKGTTCGTVLAILELRQVKR